MKFHKKWHFTRNIFQMGSQKRIHPKLSQIVFSRVKMMVNHRIWGIHSCSFPPKSGTISCQETRRWCFDRWGGSPFGCSLGPQPLNNRTTLSAGCFRIFRSIQHVFVSSSFQTFQTFQSSWMVYISVIVNIVNPRHPRLRLCTLRNGVAGRPWCWCHSSMGPMGFPSYSPVLAINWSTSPGLRTAIKSILIHLVHIVHNYIPLWSIMYHSYPFIRDKNPWFLRDFQILPWNHHTLEASHGIHGIHGHGREKLRPWTWEPLPLSLLVPRPWPRDFVE